MSEPSLGLRARLLLQKHGFQATHSLGQNFLFDEALLARLIELAGVEEGDEVLEIGPGPGVMTTLLARKARLVTAVEIDRALAPPLAEMLAGFNNVRVIYQDALRADLRALADGPVRVVANLPYYITADVLEQMLLQGPQIKTVAVLVQKEAAERMTSAPGSKRWCRLAALVQYFGAARVLAEIPPEAFEPSPHVHSSFLRLDLYQEDERPARPRDERLFLRVLAAAFFMRRKTLLNNLRAAFDLDAEAARAALAGAGLDERVRGEAVSLEGLARLADALAEREG